MMKRTTVCLLIGAALIAVLLTLRAALTAGAARPPEQSDKKSADLARRIRRIEGGLSAVRVSATDPPLRLTLEEVMAQYKVPGLSIAVIDDFKIAWAKGYGVTEAGGTVPVTPRTLFQAGSVSKPVAALGALALVEQGKLRLDEDVNARLRSWKVPENRFTRDRKVTLRRILSHTAGLTVPFFPGYVPGEPVPSVPQILGGKAPANTKPVIVDCQPGSKWRYSGGGSVVAQQLMTDVSGKPFPALMREMVFDKLGMADSTFEQPLPEARAGRAASGTYRSGKVVPGKWRVYPEAAAAGLWTTPSDLATLAIDVALAQQGKPRRVLSPATAREMLRPQAERVSRSSIGDARHPDAMGLGFFLGTATPPSVFGHIGDTAGFQTMLTMYADSGRGVVVMANSENGILVGDWLTESIAREFGWKGYVPPDRPRVGPGAVLRKVARSKGPAAALQAYRELKKGQAPRYRPDRETLISLAYWLQSQGKAKEALRAAKLAAEEFPDYWNAFDTLGEMYLHAGDKKLAIKHYEKSVALNPKNAVGVAALARLKAPADGPEPGKRAGAKVYVCPPCGLDCDRRTFDRPGVCPECGMKLIEKTERKQVTVAILLFDGVQIIDYSGPWEVFGQAGFVVHTTAEKAGPIKTTFGQRVVPDYTLANSPPADILLIPGGLVSDRLLADEKVIKWIQAGARDARHVMSVCTGAFLLAKAGLLDGKTATTFHRSLDRLARLAPKAKVVHDQRYVDNGKVLTTAGLSSGIDGALHLVAKIKGKGVAQQTALNLEYHWQPDVPFARAALADRYLPHFHGMEGTVVATQGDRDRWELRALVSAPDTAAGIIALVGKRVASATPHAATPVKVLPARKKNTEAGSEVRWEFKDDKGRNWSGIGVVESSGAEKGRFDLTLKLAHD
jgi:CubicO group peptidase (beta-lactamase class C family)/putative intracellular protease/amidase